MKFSPPCLGILLVALVLGVANSFAADLTVNVLDRNGRPARNVVVVATSSLPSSDSRPAPPAEMDQIDRQFSPYVLAVRTGTPVMFANSDSVAHQVYSFSPPKRFELGLYHGRERAPITFDQPGIVIVGCNIHDNMVGYVYVTDSPWFGKTDKDGRLQLRTMAAGEYTLLAWSPLLPHHESKLTQKVTIEEGAPAQVTFRLTRDLKAAPAPIKQPRLRDY